jgi:sugar lactone lactonase YvrE
MRRLAGVPILLAILLSLGLLPRWAGAAMAGAAGRDLLILRAGDGTTGEFITLASGARAGHQFPLGLLDHQGHMLYTATVGRDGQSVIQAIDAVSGRVLHSLALPGMYSTGNGDYVTSLVFGSGGAGNGGAQRIAPDGVSVESPLAGRLGRASRSGLPADLSEMLAVLSFNGRWLALRNQSSQDVTIVDTRAMRVAATLTLPDYLIGLDAISADGQRLYLIESLQQYGQHAYQVRLYDLRQGGLDPAPLRDKGEVPGSMDGVAWTRAWSPDGRWLYTLYVHPNGRGAFIHALSLQGRVAHCIDLPDAMVPDTVLAHYTLAVSPDGSSLYAVNPVLGRAVAVHGLPYGTPHVTTLSTRSGSPQRTLVSAALSSDGRTMFVATDHGVWAVDTGSFALRATYLSGQKVASVALGGDGRRLYALTAGSARLEALDLPSGRLLGSRPAQTGAWAIAQVISG